MGIVALIYGQQCRKGIIDQNRDATGVEFMWGIGIAKENVYFL